MCRQKSYSWKTRSWPTKRNKRQTQNTIVFCSTNIVFRRSFGENNNVWIRSFNLDLRRECGIAKKRVDKSNAFILFLQEERDLDF